MNARFTVLLSSLFFGMLGCTVAPAPSADDGVASADHTADPKAPSSASTATAPGAQAPGAGGATPPAPSGTARLDADQRLRADRLVSVFENGSIDIEYDYVEALGDGRGYTVGRGFTTATGDAFRVVDEYVKTSPTDALAAFLPELKRLADDESESISGLSGFPKAWQSAAAKPGMKTAQDHEVDRASYLPATVLFDGIGAKTALTLTVLYDTVFMHGDDTDADGAPALVKAATTKAGGTPATGIDEHVWLRAFLDVRRADLANASDPETRSVWAEAVGRADALRDLLDANNDALTGPINVGRGYDVTVP